MSQLSEQPPPRRGAKPGYYPDPLGGQFARWWDGSRWELRLGPRVAPDDPKNKAISPPSRVCPHCKVRSETFEGICPNCGKSYGQNSGLVIAAIVAACILFILFLGGCAVVFGLLVGTARDRYAISQREFDSVPLGATRASVESKLGTPLSRRHVDEEPHGPGTCLIYNRDGGVVFNFDTYELCFTNGLLYSKRGTERGTTDSYPP